MKKRIHSFCYHIAVVLMAIGLISAFFGGGGVYFGVVLIIVSAPFAAVSLHFASQNSSPTTPVDKYLR